MFRFAFLATLAIFGLASIPERAAARPYFAWVDADQPTTASYKPANMRSSFDDAHTLVKHSAVGQYVVQLGSLPEADGGNMQVQAYGVDKHFCDLAWAGDYVEDKFAIVFCYDKNGQFVDTTFTLTYVIYGQGAPAVSNAAYATYYYDPEEPWTFDPNDNHSFSTSGKLKIARWSTGVFLVLFENLSLVRPNVRVTASRTLDQHYCTFGGFTNPNTTTNTTANPNAAIVRCFDETGALVDSTFTVSYDNNSVYSSVIEAHARVTAEGAVSSYHNDGGSPITVYRNELFMGFYTVTIPAVGTPGKQDGVPQVVAESGNNNRCMIWDWYTSSQNTTDVYLRCITPTGAPAYSGFSVNYVR